MPEFFDSESEISILVQFWSKLKSEAPAYLQVVFKIVLMIRAVTDGY